MERVVNIFEKKEDLCKSFTDLVIKLLDEFTEMNIALSGGSTPKIIFDYWVAHKNSIPWDRIYFYWGDERCVSPNDEMSNYKMTKEHLFDRVFSISENNIFRIYGEDNPKKEAKRYSELLATKLPKENGIPSFQLIMLGLGDDGHTASIFPNQIDLWESKSNCVVAKHPETGMERISISGTVINNAKHVVFLATGKSKAEKVRDVVNNKKQFAGKYPAAKVAPNSGNVYWFLDTDAAKLL